MELMIRVILINQIDHGFIIRSDMKLTKSSSRSLTAKCTAHASAERKESNTAPIHHLPISEHVKAHWVIDTGLRNKARKRARCELWTFGH